MNDVCLQGVLGISRNEKLFAVQYSVDNKYIHIFFGMFQFCTIPNNQYSLLYKSTIVLLVNIGISKKDIQISLNISYKTIMKYLTAFDEYEDEQDLKNALRRPGRIDYKLNKEIVVFIIERSIHYESTGRKRFNKQIIEDVQEKYKVILSSETIRKIRRDKEQENINMGTSKKNVLPKQQKEEEVIEIDVKSMKIEDSPDREHILPVRNNYAGVLLLSDYINMVFKDFPEIQVFDNKYYLKAIMKYWIVSILLGAINFERQRYLNVEDFEYITGYNNFPSVEQMRKVLKSLSVKDDLKLVTFLMQLNISNFASKDTDYYIDGHFEEYTGEAKILKGWNVKKNRVSKGNTNYMVHDSAGNPIYWELEDQFYDFREIIKRIVERIRSITKQQGGHSYIYDRGGFSTDLMKYLEGRGDYFITWEKGFKQEDAEKIDFMNKAQITFPYNDLGKYRGYTLQFGESTWECKDYKCRKIVIERKTENEESFCQSILTNDKETEASIIVQKILKRFVQENDFKKQKNHFGLDEITSYKKLNYGCLGDKNKDKLIKNHKYREKLNEKKLLQRQAEKLYKELGLEIYNESYLNTLPTEFIEKHEVKIFKIKKIISEIEEKKKELQLIEKQIPKLEQCKNEDKVELDLRAKRILDTVKILARNIMEKGARNFLQEYGNLRDYQKVFRKLIRTGGEITIKDNKIIVKLDSFGRLKFKELCNKFFSILNQKKMKSTNCDYILVFENFQ